MTKYADDVMILTPVLRNASADEIIRMEVQRVNSWCVAHGLDLNLEKNKTIFFRKARIQHPCVGVSTLTSLILLGVIIEENLRFNLHMD